MVVDFVELQLRIREELANTSQMHVAPVMVSQMFTRDGMVSQPKDRDADGIFERKLL